MKNILKELNCITKDSFQKKFKNLNEDKIIAICDFLSRNFKYYDHGFDYRKNYFESSNIFKLINIYGYGNCIHYSFIFSFIMDVFKVKNEIIFLSSKKKFSHTINLITFNSKKYWIDLDYSLYTYRKRLIPYENIKTVIIKKKNFLNKNFKKKFIQNLSIYENPNLILHRWQNLSRSYLESINNAEIFDLYEKNYPYKRFMKQKYCKNYFFDEPFYLLNSPFKFKKVKNSYGFINGAISKKKINFHNKILNFDKINAKEFYLNNFPFPILDIKIKPSKKTTLFIHNTKIKLTKNFSLISYLLNEKVKDPIFSFKLKSEFLIENVDIQFLISDFRLRFSKFLKLI